MGNGERLEREEVVVFQLGWRFRGDRVMDPTAIRAVSQGAKARENRFLQIGKKKKKTKPYFSVFKI